MKYSTGILLSTLLVGTLAVAPDISVAVTADFNFFIANIFSRSMYNGIVLGLQQDPTNTAHECILSFGNLEAQQDSVMQFLTDLTKQAAAGTTTGNSVMQSTMTSPWYMPGTYFQLTKRYMEMGSLFFTFYK